MRGRALFEGGRLRDALTEFDRVPAGDPLRARRGRHARPHPARVARAGAGRDRDGGTAPVPRTAGPATGMKCPKCGYLGFETTDRCRNCGYDFSFAAPSLPSELPLRSRRPRRRSRISMLGATDLEPQPTGVTRTIATRPASAAPARVRHQTTRRQRPPIRVEPRGTSAGTSPITTAGKTCRCSRRARRARRSRCGGPATKCREARRNDDAARSHGDAGPAAGDRRPEEPAGRSVPPPHRASRERRERRHRAGAWPRR